MLQLDPATRAEYDALTSAPARAAAIFAALSDPVTVEVLDADDVVRAQGTMRAPWATVQHDRIVVGQLAAFAVLEGGEPDGWRIRFSAGERWLEGSFGLVGDETDFRWSLETFETGQHGAIGAVVITARGLEPVWADYKPSWKLNHSVVQALPVQWSIKETGPIVVSGVLDPIEVRRGQTYNLAQHVTGGVPPYSFSVSGPLPFGVTLSSTGVISASIDAGLGVSSSLQFTVADALGPDEPAQTVPVWNDLKPEWNLSQVQSVDATYASAWNVEGQPVEPGDLPMFGITSMSGGTDLPFAFGHIFKKGDVPAGKYVDSDLADWQCTPLTTWPDGSLRHAIICGRATCVAGVRRNIALSTADADRSGTHLSIADLKAALSSVVIKAEDVTDVAQDQYLVADASVTFSGSDFDNPHRTICTGPVMSSWMFQKQIQIGYASRHLTAWIEVRLFKGGNVEVLPWIENVPMIYISQRPTAFSLYTEVLVNGQTVFPRQELTIRHHTRPALIDNELTTFKHWSYWTAGDPQIEPWFDMDYWQATMMVPNYGWGISSDVLTRYRQWFKPNQITDVKGQMGTSNHMSYVGFLSPWDASYIAGGAPEVLFRVVIKNGFEGGSWRIHYRDEQTLECFKFTQYPNAWISYGGDVVPYMWGGDGGVNKDDEGDNASPDTAHQPSYGYLAWLVSARWWFLDEQLCWVTWNQAAQNYVSRKREKGILISGQERARDRIWRTLVCAYVALPTELAEPHPLHPDLKQSIEENCLYFRDRYVTGTVDGGLWKNDIGWLGLYSSGGGSPYPNFSPGIGNYWWASNWMMNGLVSTWGHCYGMEPDISSEAREAQRQVRDHGYKIPVGLAGPDEPGHYSYRHFAVFQIPIGQDKSGTPPERWSADYDEIFRVSKEFSFDRSPPLPPGTSIWYYNSDRVETNASHWGGHSAVIYNWVALVRAVEDGAEGAEEAWARITGSESFQNYAKPGFSNNPAFGWWPRNKPKPQ